ncbi:MAG: BolA family transcriptional regulator [Bacteriovoracaceae bacterium]|jgi:BolA family transcriptional regulator, general stress-responsive regulator|nr:BolA family transcriptional regulator [Bacteriovoracaceae bacterium]
MKIQNEVEKILQTKLGPTHLEVINESHMHNVAEGSESHFRVVVVSEKFENQMLIDRHRMVNEALGDLLKNHIHALAIISKTPAQWEKSQNNGQSPKCLG